MLNKLVKREMGRGVMEICKDLPVQKSLALLRKYKWVYVANISVMWFQSMHSDHHAFKITAVGLNTENWIQRKSLLNKLMIV